MNDNSHKEANQQYVTIVIDTDDPKWNWVLKYHTAGSTMPALTSRIAELEKLVDSLVSILMERDALIASANSILGEIIKLPDNAIADDSIKALVYEFLTGVTFDENTNNS